jgi:hypothetical protein
MLLTGRKMGGVWGREENTGKLDMATMGFAMNSMRERREKEMAMV